MQGNENSEQCESDLSFRGMHGEFKATHQKMHADHINAAFSFSGSNQENLLALTSLITT